MDKDTTPTPSTLPPGAKYRGAVVEDLQLPPAFCLPHDAPLRLALKAAYEREFDQLPVLNDRRKPIGYLHIPGIKKKFERGQASEEDPLSQHTTHFPLSSKSHPYTVINPLTPLEGLEAFFDDSGTDFALVTDQERKWVLAVATRGDLESPTLGDAKNPLFDVQLVTDHCSQTPLCLPLSPDYPSIRSLPQRSAVTRPARSLEYSLSRPASTPKAFRILVEPEVSSWPKRGSWDSSSELISGDGSRESMEQERRHHWDEA